MQQANQDQITVVTSAGVFPILPYEGSHRRKLMVKCDNGVHNAVDVLPQRVVDAIQGVVMSE